MLTTEQKTELIKKMDETRKEFLFSFGDHLAEAVPDMEGDELRATVHIYRIGAQNYEAHILNLLGITPEEYGTLSTECQKLRNKKAT